MSGLPRSFPGCTDGELRAAITDLSRELYESSASTTGSMRWAPLLQVAMNEQQNRETRRSNTTSRRVAYGAVAVSVASLIFTGAAVHYAREATRSSERWEREQIRRLDNILEEVSAARVSIAKLEAAMAAQRGSAPAKSRR